MYNSLRSGIDYAKVMCEMQRMTVVIPYLLLLSDFYDKRPKVDLVRYVVHVGTPTQAYT